MRIPNYTLGLVTGFCLGCLYLMLPTIIDGFKQPAKAVAETPKTNFTVIEKYKDCDVVQWSYGMLADYKYFLHCPK